MESTGIEAIERLGFLVTETRPPTKDGQVDLAAALTLHLSSTHADPQDICTS